MKNFRRGSSSGDFFCIIGLCLFAAFVGWLGGREHGIKTGAIRHSDGECVVVTLPDGRVEVCEVTK